MPAPTTLTNAAGLEVGTSGNPLTTTGSVTPYPTGATAITGASGNVKATAAVASLAAAKDQTTYISGFEITSGGATSAALVNPTVTGTITGTLTYTYGTVAGVTSQNAPLTVTFIPPIPASAVNTKIDVTLPSLGSGNVAATVTAHGFQL